MLGHLLVISICTPPCLSSRFPPWPRTVVGMDTPRAQPCTVDPTTTAQQFSPMGPLGCQGTAIYLLLKHLHRASSSFRGLRLVWSHFRYKTCKCQEVYITVKLFFWWVHVMVSPNHTENRFSFSTVFGSCSAHCSSLLIRSCFGKSEM